MRLQNGTPFGLTGGIHSLADDEISYWLDHVEVGNAYVNRHITGAIVRRQPFGGWKRSSMGGAPKAGGPHYVHALLLPVAAPVDVDAATENYRQAWTEHFAEAHDATGLRSESNVLRHLPVAGVVVRAGDDTPRRSRRRGRRRGTAVRRRPHRLERRDANPKPQLATRLADARRDATARPHRYR